MVAVRSQMMQDYKQVRALDYWEAKAKMELLATPRDKALLAFLFLTGCRIEECCKYTKRVPQKDGTIKTVQQGLPFEKRQIEVQEDFILIKDIRTLKRRKAVNRTIPIPINDSEAAFIAPLRAYLEGLRDDEPLFPFTRQWAFTILSRVGIFPHLMRHSRNTINVRNYDLGGHHLQKFNGWSNSKSADAYLHLSVTDITDKMRKTKN